MTVLNAALHNFHTAECLTLGLSEALSDKTSLSRAGQFRSLPYDKTLPIQVLKDI